MLEFTKQEKEFAVKVYNAAFNKASIDDILRYYNADGTITLFDDYLDDSETIKYLDSIANSPFCKHIFNMIDAIFQYRLNEYEENNSEV